MLASELKKEVATVLQKIVGEHQERRKAVTDDIVLEFMRSRPLTYKQ